MLSGTYQYNIDLKGRLNFPARLREELGNTFVIAKSMVDPCLTVYSLDQWQKLVQTVTELPIGKGRAIKRHLFASSLEVVADKQGRILIPQNLMEYAHLSKEATVLGVMDYCEIWDKATYETQQQQEGLESISELVLELGL